MRYLLPARVRLPIWNCPICGSLFNKISPCDNCRPKLTPAPAAKNALYIYDENAKRLVHGIKYKNCLSPINWIAERYVEQIGSQDIDLIAWIPASQIQKQKRRYDQCELLARAIGGKMGIPSVKLIGRGKDLPQTHKKSNRHIGPNLQKSISMNLLWKSKVKDKKVLLIDDVITTGTSIKKGKAVLESYGVGEIEVLAIAATKFTPVSK